MRFKLVALMVALGLGTWNVHAQQQFQVFASVVDASGTSPAVLQPGDVRILEDGMETNVIKIEPLEWPLKVQLLIDNGIGLGGENLIHIRNGLRGLLEALPEGVEGTFVTTAPQPRFLVRATTDRQALLKGIDLLSSDSGAGRFVESLNEATQRIEKDKGDYFSVIISVGSTAGDLNILERDVQRLMQRLQQRPTTVHVVLSRGSRASGGDSQIEVGLAVTKFTGGRYESLAAPSRLATLLPEIGAQVAESHKRHGRQFRITVSRPKGTTGTLGKVSMAAQRGLVVSGVSLDGPVH
jgi:hypothetical protein